VKRTAAAGPAARNPRSLFPRSFRFRPATGVSTKLLAPVFAILAALILAQAFMSSARAIHANAVDEKKNLLTAYRGYQNEIAVLERESSALALSIASRPLIQQYAAAQDRGRLLGNLEPLLERFKGDYNIPYMSVLRPNGFMLLRVHDRARFGDVVTPYRPTVAAAMAERRVKSGVELDPEGLGIRGVAPIFHEGQLVGIMEIGRDYNRAFLEELKTRTGLDYAIWLTFDAAAPTGFWPRGPLPASPSPEIFAYAATTGALMRSPASLYREVLARPGEPRVIFGAAGGSPVGVLLSPLYGFNERVLGIMEITASRSENLARLRNNQILTALYSAILGILSLTLLWITIHRVVLAPLGRLAEAAHRRMRGDLDARVTVIPRDEFGEVAGVFNQMTEQMGRYIADLEAQVQAIKKAEEAAMEEVAERRRAEAARDATEATNRAITEAIPDAIFRMDREGRFIDYIPGKSTQAAVPPSLFLGRKPGEVLPQEIGDGIEAHVAEVLQTGRTEVYEYALELDGEMRSFEARIVLAGEYGLLGIVRDVTDRARMERETEQLAAQLLQAQKMESIGRLAGGVAHDFNNLLTPILGYASLLASSGENPQETRQMAGEMLAAGRKAKDLVGQLLAFSRKQILEMRVCDLNRIIQGFERILRRTIRENIDIRVTAAAGLWPVRADRSQIEQIIMNLAVNAQDAMPDGGTMAIETANTLLDGTAVGTHSDVPPGEYALVCVSDTGAGMSADVKAHLFEPFFTTKKEGVGTGLGLATVFGIVRQHGGSMSVYSEPGSGTTFKIYLPRVLEAPESEAQAAAAPQAEAAEKTVLLVEDTEMVRRMIRAALGLKGFRILEAASGEAAITLVEGGPGHIDLLLTDVIMPRMNGPQLFERLSRLLPGLRVLYMSGYADSIISTHGVLASGTNFIQKPFTVEALLEKLAAVMP
jgi:two-component system, cell cycle sensor histidine kinase and response regulator CckA